MKMAGNGDVNHKILVFILLHYFLTSQVNRKFGMWLLQERIFSYPPVQCGTWVVKNVVGAPQSFSVFGHLFHKSYIINSISSFQPTSSIANNSSGESHENPKDSHFARLERFFAGLFARELSTSNNQPTYRVLPHHRDQRRGRPSLGQSHLIHRPRPLANNQYPSHTVAV